VSSHRSGAHGERGRERGERAPKIPKRGAPKIPGSVLTLNTFRSTLRNFGSALPPALLGCSRSERAPGLRSAGGGGAPGNYASECTDITVENLCRSNNGASESAFATTIVG
jgi:hypothetical protein